MFVVYCVLAVVCCLLLVAVCLLVGGWGASFAVWSVLLVVYFFFVLFGV